MASDSDAGGVSFNRQYRGEAFELPAEVEAMPIFREWAANTPHKIASPFWKSLNPKRTSAVWILAVASAFNLSLARLASIFYGQEISTVAGDALNARGLS